MLMADQFGKANVQLGHPTQLCAPVEFEGSKINDKDTHFVCYETLSQGPSEPIQVETKNILDNPNRLAVGQRNMVCLPSSKEHK
jgi:hypothetical protein